MLDYLTDTAISPLQQTFVQVTDPYCSKIDVQILDQSECGLLMSFRGVPVAKEKLIKER